MGVEDACGVCNGPGEIYNCGCFDQPAGDCDCFGSQPDAFGVCGASVRPMRTAMAFVMNASSPKGTGLRWMWWRCTTRGVGRDDDVPGEFGLSRFDGLLRQVAAFADSPLTLNATSGSWYNHPANDDWRPLGILADSVAAHPELAYDSFLTIGVEDGAADVAPPGSLGGILPRRNSFPPEAKTSRSAKPVTCS